MKAERKTLRQIVAAHPEHNLFCTYNQNAGDLEFVAGYIGIDDPGSITGAIGLTENGEFVDLWISHTHRPWDLIAFYEHVIRRGRQLIYWE
jgi:hypothetical protein